MLKKTYERLLMLSMVVSASVGCDQITKRIAEHSLENKSYSFLFDTLRLHHIKNTGAFLGAGANYNSSLKFILFIIFPVLFLGAGIIYVALKSSITRLQVLCGALIIGGGIGNLIDRIFFQGEVTDFLNVGIGSLRTGIFNIADFVIMIGAFGLFFLGFKQPKNN